MGSKNGCDKSMSFEDCELTILRSAIDLAQEKVGKQIVGSKEVQEIIKIVEDFLKRKNLVAYGGASANAILPKNDQFYNKETDLPDYDFYSPNALDDAKELADIYAQKGYSEVEAKSGQHHGTYKVFVNFLGIADITQIPKDLFETIKKESIRVAGILYTPPNYLRMGMYLELSRPSGDVDRWNKVYKRLNLLNKHFPLTEKQCATVDFQRKMGDPTKEDEIYETVKNTFIDQDVVFFGGYAISLYSKYMPESQRKQLEKIPDFDVLSTDPETTAEIVKERLIDSGIKNVKIIKREAVGEVVPLHYEIQVGNDAIAFIYQTVACHSYNEININTKQVKIATIDTMLSFYLAFLYANKPYYDKDRILCMAKFLFDVQQKNRLEQKGLLKRFSISCYGHQETVEEMRAEKAAKFKELKDKRGTREYEEYFLAYRPTVKQDTEPKLEPKPESKPKSKTKSTKRRPKSSFFTYKYKQRRSSTKKNRKKSWF